MPLTTVGKSAIILFLSYILGKEGTFKSAFWNILGLHSNICPAEISLDNMSSSKFFAISGPVLVHKLTHLNAVQLLKIVFVTRKKKVVIIGYESGKKLCFFKEIMHMLLEKQRIFFIVPSIFHVFKRWKQKQIDRMKIFPRRGLMPRSCHPKTRWGHSEIWIKRKGFAGVLEREVGILYPIKFFYRDFDNKMHRFWYLLHKIELCFRKSYNSFFFMNAL